MADSGVVAKKTDVSGTIVYSLDLDDDESSEMVEIYIHDLVKDAFKAFQTIPNADVVMIHNDTEIKVPIGNSIEQTTKDAIAAFEGARKRQTKGTTAVVKKMKDILTAYFKTDENLR